MTAVDHDVGRKASGLKICLTLSNVLGAVIGAMAAASEHNMAVAIAAGLKNRDLAFRVDTQKTVRIGN